MEASWRYELSIGVTPIVELSFMPAILAGCTWTSPRTGRVVNPGHKACTTIMQYKGIKEHPTRWEDWHDLVKVQPHRTRLANRVKKKKARL